MKFFRSGKTEACDIWKIKSNFCDQKITDYNWMQEKEFN